MSSGFTHGAKVKWHWGTGTATGKVEDRFERAVSRTIKGKRIRRNGSAENPAYLIRQEDGDAVLKLGSELEKG